MSLLRLTRPLVFLDLETTGTDPESDRIVEIAVLKITPDGKRERRVRRVNPERPIPPEAAAIHGIRDEDVRDAPRFRQVARSLLDFLEGADLAGFNVRRFDVPLLDREFRDCGCDLRLGERFVIDAMTVFHRKEPRNLEAAVRFYLGRDHEGAHGAGADVDAAAEVLEAQLARYEDVPREVETLDRWCGPSAATTVDREGKLVWSGGRAVFAFGKFQGKSLEHVARARPDYLEWIARSDFPRDTKEIAERALRGEFPEPPEA